MLEILIMIIIILFAFLAAVGIPALIIYFVIKNIKGNISKSMENPEVMDQMRAAMKARNPGLEGKELETAVTKNKGKAVGIVAGVLIFFVILFFVGPIFLGEEFTVVFFLVPFSILMIYLGIIQYKKRMDIIYTPTSTVRGAAMGEVELKGQALATEVLNAPYTGEKCIGYSFKVTETRSSGDSSYTETLKSDYKIPKFYFNDDTGKVLVDPTGMELNVSPSFSFTSSPFKPIPDEISQKLLSFGITRSGRQRNQLNIEERIIPLGKKLYLFGNAGKNPYIQEGTAQFGSENMMISKGTQLNKLFTISDSSEKSTANKYLISSIIAFLIGGLLIIGTLYIILVKLVLF
ncbi:MAG: E3 ubiquitin ligase family protein [Nanoarchaeota archaeon]|nr:E3 ubiquitin ligase family protein [Nanoarchaeota archaeon]